MKAKELSGTAFTLAGLAAGIFGAMLTSDGRPWPLGVPLCLLALPLLVMGYRLLQLPSSMDDAPRGPAEAPALKARRASPESPRARAVEAAEAPPAQGG
jgi:hypothetical protein